MGLDIRDGTPTAISKLLRENEEGKELKQYIISGCGYKDSCKDLDKAKGEARRDSMRTFRQLLDKHTDDEDYFNVVSFFEEFRKLEKELKP